MKTCINIVLLVLGLTANAPMLAQQWCPPGAEWRYPYITQLHPQQGTLRYTYEGDSLYQGEVCQHFVSRVYFPDQTQWGPWHSFTTAAPGVIIFWNTLASQFDTLVNFDAMPGSGWSFIGFQSQEYFITVQDTGVRTIDGIPLRYLVITSDPPWFGLPTDTIHERIGALNLHNFFPVENYFMETPTLNGVGCYQDDEMQYSRPFPIWLATPCDIALSLLNLPAMTGTTLSVYPNQLRIHPNPASTWVAIDYDLLVEPTDAAIIIRDMTGREVKRIVLRDRLQQVVWDSREVAPGTYTVVLQNKKHQLRTEKLIIRQ